MNPLPYALAAWLALGMELGLKPILDAGSGGISPSFVIPLVVFIALHAPARQAIWAALLTGLTLDLITPLAMIDGGSAVIPGPHAIGTVLAAELTLALRGMVIRRNPMTLVVLSVVASVVSSLAFVTLLGLRGLADDGIVWRGTGELIPRFLSALYTALSALVLSFPLFAATPLFGFPSTHTPKFARRD